MDYPLSQLLDSEWKLKTIEIFIERWNEKVEVEDIIESTEKDPALVRDHLSSIESLGIIQRVNSGAYEVNEENEFANAIKAAQIYLESSNQEFNDDYKRVSQHFW